MLKLLRSWWAFGRAIGKSLGRREANDNDNDAPSGEGLPHLPVDSDNKLNPPTAAEELKEEQQQPPVEGVIDVEGFPRRPHDTSVLRDFQNHIALRERPELKLSSHERKMAKFRRPALEIEGLVIGRRLSPSIACSLHTGD
ncbi:hypothetical protein GmHk_14G041913 [Glycine max]|nr:hypothetical protein GmHk_14G041913 [Glycine max]